MNRKKMRLLVAIVIAVGVAVLVATILNRRRSLSGGRVVALAPRAGRTAAADRLGIAGLRVHSASAGSQAAGSGAGGPYGDLPVILGFGDSSEIVWMAAGEGAGGVVP